MRLSNSATSRCAPQRVGLATPAVGVRQPDVQLGRRQLRLTAQFEHQLLAVAAGERRADRPFGEDRLQRRRASSPVGPREHFLERAQIEQSQHLRLLAGALRCACVDDVGEVEERAGDRCAGNVLDGYGVGRCKGRATVDVDSGTTASRARRRDHIDRSPAARPQPPQRRRRAMRQQRAGPAGQHRCDEAPLAAERDLAHDVDLPVNALPAADLDAFADGRGAQPERDRLRQRHHAVLSPRLGRDCPLQRGVWQLA